MSSGSASSDSTNPGTHPPRILRDCTSFGVAKAGGLKEQADGGGADGRGKSPSVRMYSAQCTGVGASPGSGNQEMDFNNKKEMFQSPA